MDRERLMERIDSNGRFNLPTVELELLADHLIANGIGDIADLKAENERLTKQLENSVQLPCKEECNETEKLYGVYGEDNEGVPCDNPNKIFSDIKMAKEYAILQKGKIAWGIAPVYEIFPKTVYEKVKKIDVRE